MASDVGATDLQDVLFEVGKERWVQDKKWGVQNHIPAVWITILTEELGEASKAALEGRPDDYIEELTQVAAVAVAAIQCIRRIGTNTVSITDLQQENAKLHEILEGQGIDPDVD